LLIWIERKEGGNGRRWKDKSNNFVGKREETYKIAGSGSVGLRIDSKFINAVRDDPLGGL
jgi:hypothetical protein